MKIDYPATHLLPELKQLWQICFGDETDYIETFFSAAFSPQRCRCVIQDGKLAAALYWFDCQWQGQLCAYLYAVATAPEFRGQGLCTALLEDTHRLLTQQGYVGTVLVPGENSLFSFYEKLGYAPFGGMTQLTCAPLAPVALTPLTAQEYAAARRKYLPDGGIVQEGENLAFLQKQAFLYAGENFLLAAAKTGDCLRGIELLGDPSAAGGIVSSLGAKRGIFATAGDAPFAMCRPLLSGFSPTYFGLAFD